jgi:hypothetical protein
MTRSAAAQGARYGALALILRDLAAILGGRLGAVTPAVAHGDRRV